MSKTLGGGRGGKSGGFRYGFIAGITNFGTPTATTILINLPKGETPRPHHHATGPRTLTLTTKTIPDMISRKLFAIVILATSAIAAMFSKAKVTEIYCLADDFCKEFAKYQENHMLPTFHKSGKHRNESNRMSDAEIMLIMILFHSGGYLCFKHFYLEYVCKHLAHLFPRKVSYNRFVELEKEVLFPLAIFIKTVLIGRCTGISFVDSTPLRVCRNQRIHIHKTFEGLATRGKCSMGWFFGFKLHLIINDKGEILNFMFTLADVDDRQPLKQGSFLNNIKGKLCADKGYIGQYLFDTLFVDGIQLITKIKNNMKNVLMNINTRFLSERER